MNYGKIEESLGYAFKDKGLLKTALTLASADQYDNNQTLEFFGDAILEFIVSEHIYDKYKSEGELTELRKLFVSDTALYPVSEKLGLKEHFIRGPGDTVLKKSIPSAYEAVLAAIYLDGGMDEARSFVLRTLDFSTVRREENYKGELQELLQSRGLAAPVYGKEDVGTPKSPRFRCSVTVYGKTFEGEAENVKKAERLAAKRALTALRKN